MKIHHATSKKWLRMFMLGMSMGEIAANQVWPIGVVEDAIRDEVLRMGKRGKR